MSLKVVPGDFDFMHKGIIYAVRNKHFGFSVKKRYTDQNTGDTSSFRPDEHYTTFVSY